jgi:hypothetical protein
VDKQQFIEDVFNSYCISARRENAIATEKEDNRLGVD